jgi:hypothetical protein
MMAGVNHVLERFKPFATPIGEMLNTSAPAADFAAESATAVQVERGTIFVRALLDSKLSMEDLATVERLIELTSSPRLAELAIVDASGHHRPVYRALLIYAWLQSFRIAYETLPQSQFGRWEEAVRVWCDLLEAELGQIDLPESVITAGRGASATESAFTALALFVAGKVFVRDAWIDLASDLFGRITRAQQPSGAFLLAGSSDNPDTHGYHELVILHAAASYAVQAEDRRVASAVVGATEYHLRQTQPDHATNQPWGLFAFIWNDRTRSLADQLLHATQARDDGRIDGVSLMLLADALYCLRQFLK